MQYVFLMMFVGRYRCADGNDFAQVMGLFVLDTKFITFPFTLWMFFGNFSKLILHMKKNLSQLLTLSLSLFLLFFFSCKKNLTPSNNSNSLDTSRLLKQYRMYFQPQVSPDSVIVNVSYDTVNRTITLNQYFDGTQSSPTSWKYFYNQAGYLTSINDISYGSPGNNMASILYDQNMDIKMVIVPYSPKTDSIYYTTNYNANGKEVILYDTSLSGYLGGTKFGVGKIIYNNQGQMTDRYLFGPGPSGTFDTSQLKLGVHEFFYYDVNGNLTIYQTGGDTLYQNASFK